MSLASRKLIQATAGAAGADTGDDDFANVVLLLDGDGTSGDDNNTFTDSSTNNLTITESGSVVQGSFSPYGDNWSVYFDGSGDYLSADSLNIGNFGTADFTVEGWFYLTTAPVNYIAVCETRASGATTAGWTVSIDGSGSFYVYSGAYIAQSASGTIESNTLYHWAYTRESGTHRLFLNGSLVASGTTSRTYSDNNFRVGANLAGLEPFTGYESNVRVVKNNALYTSGFTPPTGPLSAVTGTSFLGCQSNRFIDNSSNGHTITVNGTPKVTPFSPFKNDDARTLTTDGGSAYLNDDSYKSLGAGDGNILPATDDFTIEGWFYHTGLHSGGRSAFFCKDKGSFRDANDGVITSFFENNGTTINNFTATLFKDGVNQNVNIDWPYTFNLFEWYHVAFVRYGSTVELFINGESQGTGTGVTTLEQNNDRTNYIASWRSDKRDELVGYVSDFRIVSSQVYTTDFTPPTSPLTAITNTELLLSFQDAGIYDRSGINNLDTVGNAQIDTAVKKYGTGSMEFDGTGDYLLLEENMDIFEFGSGDFTIEFWLYPNDVSSNQTILDFRPNNTNGAYATIVIDNTSDIRYVSNSSDQIISSSISASSWIHVSLCRSGTSTKLFIDGTQEGSTYSDSQTYLEPSRVVIGAGSFSLGGNPFDGYIDDLRITKGIARYTSSFTPPTAALPKF